MATQQVIPRKNVLHRRIPSWPPPPITRMPVEVILEIIELAAANDPDYPRDIPTVASQVCKKWRTITLGAPRLWSKIEIANTPVAGRELEPQLVRASTYAARSLERPLRLFLSVGPLQYGHRGGERAARAIAGFLAEHMYRVRELTLSLMGGFQRTEIRDMLPLTHAPLLQTCTITGAYTLDAVQDLELFEPPAFPWFESSEGDSPADRFTVLKRLSLTFSTLKWSRFAPTNLRSLTLIIAQEEGRPTWAELRTVLQANAHTLKNLRLTTTFPRGQSANGQIRLPALTTLSLGPDPTRALALFVSMVELPVLSTFALRGVRYQDTPEDWLSFSTMMAHLPSHRIGRLFLTHVRFGFSGHVITSTFPPAPADEGSERFPRAMFSEMGNLHTLSLMYPDVTTVAALTRAPSGGAPPAPKLAQLGLTCESQELLQAFLLQRAQAEVPPLKELWVSWQHAGQGMGAGVAMKVIEGILLEDDP